VKDARVYLRHIADAILRIDSFMPADKESFLRDIQCQDAVMRNLAVIGEATKKLPRSVWDQHPQVPWKAIAGMRDKLIHDYVSVDVTVVWDTVQRDLPVLHAAVERLLHNPESKAA
jgi:uncharacterized protein with HEPN domain